MLGQLALALLAREHALITGPPGTAKSQIASAVLARIVDETSGAPSLYARQFTESTVQTDLVGPINFKTLMDTGRTEHFTDEGMLGAVHAFLDEVLDGRDMLLRSALNVLQERELKQGTRTTRGQIECAAMTTNRYLAEVLESARETLLAFVDRVAFVSFVPKGFADPANLGLVLKRRLAGSRVPPLSAPLTIQDLDVLQATADAVHVPDAVCDALVHLLALLDGELAAAARADPSFVPTRYLSVRTAVRAGGVLRAICVHDKLFRAPDRPLVATQGDLASLRLHLLLGGPSPEAVGKLLARETDPRERRQLAIVRTERELFERCLAQLPPPAAPPPPAPAIDLASARKTLDAAATPAGDLAQLARLAGELAQAADGVRPGATEAAELLHQTVGALTERALREGLTAGAAAERGLAPAVRELSELADALERTASSTRPLARWLRGRALALIDDLGALPPAAVGLTVDALSGQGGFDAAAQRAEARVAALEALGAARAGLRAKGADPPGGEDGAGAARESGWGRAVERAVEELAIVLDAGFRAAVGETLENAPREKLGQVLKWLAPTFARVEALDARLGALGGAPGALKSRVIGPRVWPLVAAVFERLDTRDRGALLGELDALLDELARAGLRAVLAPRDLLAWSTAALLRSETAAPARGGGATGDDAQSPRSLAGFRRLREREQRVPLVYTLVEVALRAAPAISREMASPGEATTAVSGLLAELPEAQRSALASADLARVGRAVAYLEAWWDAVAGGVDAATLRGADAAKCLTEVNDSGFLHVAYDEAALARFALEARVVAEALPAHAGEAQALRGRIGALEARATAFVYALARAQSKAAWAALLASASVPAAPSGGGPRSSGPGAAS